MAQVYRTVWPESPYMASKEIMSSLVASPAYKEGEGYIAYNSSSEPMGFYILWLDEYSKHAHLYPFAINEKVLETELPKILLTKGIERLQEIGAASLTISAWYKPREESVFKELGFKTSGSTYIYTLPISL